MADNLMSSSEAAEFLGFTDGWMAKLRMRGDGPKWIRLGRKVRYLRADLDAWIAKHRVSSTSEKCGVQMKKHDDE